MADTYKFKTPNDLELLEEVPETANAIVEVDGEMKRVPGSNLGGGTPTAIWKLDLDDTASLSLNGGVAVASDTDDKARAASTVYYTATCDNMTFAEAKELMLAGELVRFKLYANTGAGVLSAMDIFSSIINTSGTELICAVFSDSGYIFGDITMYWGKNGAISSDFDDVAGK